MNYLELEIKVKLYNDLAFIKSNEFLSQEIFKTMLNDSYLKELHSQKRFKPYVFSPLYPFEYKTKTYEKDKEYSFFIRSIDERFLKALNFELQVHNKLRFKIINTKLHRIPYRFVEKIFTFSPALLTLPSSEGKNRYLDLKYGDIMMLQERIVSNLFKKYKYFFITPPINNLNYATMIHGKNRCKKTNTKRAI